MLGDDSSELAEQILHEQATMPGQVKTDNFFEKGWAGVMRIIPQFGEQLRQGLEVFPVGAMAGAAAAMIAGQAGPQIVLPEEVLTVPITGAIAGTGYAFVVGRAKAAFMQEAGSAWLEFKDFKDENGGEIDQDVQIGRASCRERVFRAV